MEKIEIRKMMRAKISEFDGKQIMHYSNAIVNHIERCDIFQKAESIFLFNSLEYEPQMQRLIQKSLDMGKRVYLPTLVFDEMYPVEVFENTKYYLGKYNISEPFGDIYFGDIDITVMPLTAFDKDLNRIGKGGGYYDKYLSNHHTYKMGVGYSVLEIDKIYTLNYDVKLDAVVTEKGILYADNKR